MRVALPIGDVRDDDGPPLTDEAGMDNCFPGVDRAIQRSFGAFWCHDAWAKSERCGAFDDDRVAEVIGGFEAPRRVHAAVNGMPRSSLVRDSVLPR